MVQAKAAGRYPVGLRSVKRAVPEGNHRTPATRATTGVPVDVDVDVDVEAEAVSIGTGGGAKKSRVRDPPRSRRRWARGYTRQVLAIILGWGFGFGFGFGFG